VCRRIGLQFTVQAAVRSACQKLIQYFPRYQLTLSIYKRCSTPFTDEDIQIPHHLQFPSKQLLHCKKRLPIFPSPAGMSLTKLSLDGNTVIKFFPTRESLVSDIPAGDGKIDKHFLQCIQQQTVELSYDNST
jgi:hypothetical protein